MPAALRVCADAGRPSPAIEANRKPKVVDEPRFKIASQRGEFEAAYRLVHDAYVRQGLTEPLRSGMRITPYQLLPTTDVLVALVRDEVFCTMSLVADGEMGLPMESIFAEELALRRQQGLRLAEVSCLADRRSQLSRSLPALYGLMRLMVQSARARGVDQLLVACHPRHAKFYRRALGFDTISEVRSYQTVRGNPAVALVQDLNLAQQNHPELYRRFFGQRLPESALRPRPMSDHLRENFRCLMEADMFLARESHSETAPTWALAHCA